MLLRCLLAAMVLPPLTAPCPLGCRCAALTFSCKDLTFFPFEYPRQAVVFDLSHNEFNRLPLVLRNVLRLQDLDLSHNLLQEVPKSFLSEATGLKRLFLGHNRLRGLPVGLLDGLSRLEEVDLSHNTILYLANLHPDTAFFDNNHLKMLDLSWNPLKELSGKEGERLESDSLEELELVGCSLQEVSSSSLAGLPALLSLGLARNPLRRLHSLPSPTLTHLDISANRLRYVSPELLEKLPSLEWLDISENPGLERLGGPGGAVSHSLRFINASFCSFTALKVGGFPVLDTLLMVGNNITDIPPYTFKICPNLKTIDLSSNSIRYVVGSALWGLKGPLTVDLSRNLLVGFDREAFSGVTGLNLSWNPLLELQDVASPSMKSLNVSHCDVSLISPTLLAALPALTVLDLSHNSLKSFPPSLSSISLTHLDLSRNRLTELQTGSFPRLNTVDLRYNLLREPPPRLPEGTLLGGNPWHCDCELLRPGLEELRCASPPSASGWTLASFCLPRPVARPRSTPWLPLVVALGSVALVLCSLVLVRRRLRISSRPVASASCGTPAPPPPRPVTFTEPPPRRLPPDPLPSYEEALLMPRLLSKKHSAAQTDDPHFSMADLAASRASLPRMSSSF